MTIGSAFVRHLFDFIDICFGVGILVMYNSYSRQRIGDQIAKTVVLEYKLAQCENCKTELELNAYEQKTGQFVCPLCKHENKNAQL
jgi:Zn finger protein HypA/HybF involved in hydrogenase expression